MPNKKKFRDGLLHSGNIGFHELGIDLQAHLLAIKNLLHRNRKIDEELKLEIDSLIKQAEQATNDYDPPHEDDRLVFRLHDEAFQSAAHSMAAVGMLAPFVEMLFVRIFASIRDQKLHDPPPKMEFWDPTRKDEHRGGISKGIKTLAVYSGFADFLPNDYHRTVEALFCYRNAMFHNGFEWPNKKREKFQKACLAWPDGWFERASRDGFFTNGVEADLHPDTRRFDMQAKFIEHCLDTIDKVIDGFIKFVKKHYSSISLNLIDVLRNPRQHSDLFAQSKKRP